MAPYDLLSVTCSRCSSVLCISSNTFIRVAEYQVTPYDTTLFSNCGLKLSDVPRLRPEYGLFTKAQACKRCGLLIGFLGRAKTPSGRSEGSSDCYLLDPSQVIAKAVLTQKVVRLNVIKTEEPPSHELPVGPGTPPAFLQSPTPSSAPSRTGSEEPIGSRKDPSLTPPCSPPTAHSHPCDNTELWAVINGLKNDLAATRDAFADVQANNAQAEVHAGKEEFHGLYTAVIELKEDLANTREDIAAIRATQAQLRSNAKHDDANLRSRIRCVTKDVGLVRKAMTEVTFAQTQAEMAANETFADIQTVNAGLRQTISKTHKDLAETTAIQAQAQTKVSDDFDGILTVLHEQGKDIATIRASLAGVQAVQAQRDESANDARQDVRAFIRELHTDIAAIQEDHAAGPQLDGQVDADANHEDADDTPATDEPKSNERKPDLFDLEEDVAEVKTREMQLTQRIIAMDGDICRIGSRLSEADALKSEVARLRLCVQSLEEGRDYSFPFKIEDGPPVLESQGQPAGAESREVKADLTVEQSPRPALGASRPRKRRRLVKLATSDTAPALQPTVASIQSPATVSTHQKPTRNFSEAPGIPYPNKPMGAPSAKRSYSEAFVSPPAPLASGIDSQTAFSKSYALRRGPRPSYKLKRRHPQFSQHVDKTIGSNMPMAGMVATAVHIPQRTAVAFPVR